MSADYRNMTKEELAAHYGDRLRQTTDEERAELLEQQLRLLRNHVPKSL